MTLHRAVRKQSQATFEPTPQAASTPLEARHERLAAARFAACKDFVRLRRNHPCPRGPRPGAGTAEIFTHHLTHRIDHRALLNIGGQGVIDQGLVVASAGLLDHPAKILDDAIVEPDRQFGFAGFQRHHRAAFGGGKVDLAIKLSGDFSYCFPCGLLAFQAEISR